MEDFNRINAHQLKIIEEIKKLKPVDSNIWVNKWSLFLERLLAIGWMRNDNLLAVTNNNILVIDSHLGTILQNTYVDSIWDFFLHNNLGIIFNDEELSVFGIMGGDGNKVNMDGWKLQVDYPYWPNAVVKLYEPTIISNSGNSIISTGKILKLKEIGYYDLKCGFSNKNNKFIVCNGNGIELFEMSFNPERV